MQKSVPNVPSYDEFFGLEDNFLDDADFEAENDDEDIKKMLLIMLGLLEEFYIERMYETAYYYSSEQFQDDIIKFNGELKDNLYVLFSAYISGLTTDYNIKWNLPDSAVAVKIELEEMINSGIDSVTHTLYYDLKDKADFYTSMATTAGTFSPHANFRRAIKRLTNQVDYKGNHIRKVIDRGYDEFVYGQDALFEWVCSGINTCAWCYEIEAMGAMPLSYFPVDHINGRCVLRPVNPDEYSKEYLNARRD